MEIRISTWAFLLIAAVMMITGVNCLTNGDVRLSDGHSPAEGRVEVYYNGEWGTICDDGWDMSDANVVCRQLGFSSANVTYCCAHFGHGEGQIVLDDLSCTGGEFSLSDCSHRGWEQHNCAHTEDASVTCNGKIRLMDGTNVLEGRVEVYHNNSWGTVCNVGWDLKDASVICRQMGYPSANSTSTPQQFGETRTRPVVFNVECAGDESDLDDCPKNWTSSCPGFGTDPQVGAAGIVCTRPIRLMDGNSDMEGNVQIFDGNGFGSVCDQGWDMNAAAVVCRQLGKYAPLEATTGSRHGTSLSPMKISGVRCTGTETALEQCGNSGWNHATSSCSGENLAGVVCTSSVRFAAGSDSLEGRVEVYINNTWGNICYDGWDDKDAEVFCRQLGGYPVQEACCDSEPTPEGVQVLISHVGCEGNETTLQDCPFRVASSCSTVARVGCQSTIRLSSTDNPLMGNVEVLYNGEWGIVCDDNWGIEDAQVVCRQLGNFEAVSSSCCAQYGTTSLQIHLDDVGCTGSESKLEDCYHSSWGSHNCGSSEAAGVSCRQIRLVTDESTSLPKGRVEIVKNGQWGRICGQNWGQEEADVLCRQLYNSSSEPLTADFGAGSGPVFYTNMRCEGGETNILDCPFDEMQDGNVCSVDAYVVCRGGLRLAGGRTPLEGRVEIFHDGQWGTICDDSWDINDAKVICKQLGNYEVLSAKCCAAYGQGTGPILLDGVACTGNEDLMEDCPNEGWGSHNCQHYEDASVACTDLRLTYANGSVSTNELQGRVEVWRSGHWRTICYDSFELPDAEVICKQLFNTIALKTQSYKPSSTDLSIGISSLRCTGNESLLLDCDKDADNAVNCPTQYSAGVECKDIRLIGGSVPSEGAIEILENGQWGLICGDMWDLKEGRVACRQLGYCAPLDTMRGWTKDLVQRNEMHWYGMNCTGDESRLRDCFFQKGSFPCHSYHFEAAVICGRGCDAPPVIRHGTYKPQNIMYEIGDFVTYTCEKDYQLIGKKDLLCSGDCSWSSMAPECQRELPGDDIGDKGDSGSQKGNANKSTSKQGGSGMLFLAGLFVGAVIIVIVISVAWLIRLRRRNQLSGGSSIFKTRRQEDEMEEPVLNFQNCKEHDDDINM